MSPNAMNKHEINKNEHLETNSVLEEPTGYVKEDSKSDFLVEAEVIPSS